MIGAEAPVLFAKVGTQSSWPDAVAHEIPMATSSPVSIHAGCDTTARHSGSSGNVCLAAACRAAAVAATAAAAATPCLFTPGCLVSPTRPDVAMSPAAPSTSWLHVVVGTMLQHTCCTHLLRHVPCSRHHASVACCGICMSVLHCDVCSRRVASPQAHTCDIESTAGKCQHHQNCVGT
jgi:hypothetical protein